MIFRFEEVVKLLVGNKVDSERVVSREEAAEWAKSRGMIFVETSAKTTEGVSQVFSEVVQQVSVQPAVLLLMTAVHYVPLTLKCMTLTVTLTLSCRFLRSPIYCPTHGRVQPEGAGQFWTPRILRLREAVAASLGLCSILLCFAFYQSESPMIVLDWASFQRNVAHSTEGTSAHVSLYIEAYSINYGSDSICA
jgi:Ras family